MKFTCLSLLPVLVMGSCIPKTRTDQLAPALSSSTRTGQAVTVDTALGSDQTKIEGLAVPMSDFKGALEKSLVDSGLFQQIGDGGYRLQAVMVGMSQPYAVFGVTTDAVVDYTLRKSGSVVWTKTIRSNHVTETSESLVSEIRNRNSAEGAIRENIRLAIGAMSEQLK